MKYLNYLLFLLLLSACVDEDARRKPFEDIKEEKLTMERLSDFPSDSLLAPKALYCMGNNIVIQTDKGTHNVSVFNTENRSFTRYIKKGEGPNEALNIAQVFDGERQNEIIAYCEYNKGFYQVNFETQLSEPLSKKNNIFQNFNIINGNKFIGCPESGSPRYAISDKNFNIIDQYGNFTDEMVNGDVDKSKWAYLYAGKTVVNKELNKFASFSFFAQNYEIVTFEGDKIIDSFAKFYSGVPAVESEFEMPSMTKDTRLTFTSLTADSQYIYALYNGLSFQEVITTKGIGGDGLHSKYILVYNWDGQLIKNYELDQEVLSISYNKNDGYIYALSEVDEPEVLFFKPELSTNLSLK